MSRRSSAFVSAASMAACFAMAAGSAAEPPEGASVMTASADGVGASEDALIPRHSSEARDDRAELAIESAESVRDPGVEAVPAHTPWPCRLICFDDLQPFVQRAWDLSATFRDQCRKLAAARAVIMLRSTSESQFWRAKASISRSSEGAAVALVRVRRVGRTVELIAHELEHVLERVEGVNYLLESRRGGSALLLPGGAFETRRAIDAGQRVAREVEMAARAARQVGK